MRAVLRLALATVGLRCEPVRDIAERAKNFHPPTPLRPAESRRARFEKSSKMGVKMQWGNSWTHCTLSAYCMCVSVCAGSRLDGQYCLK